MPAQSEAQRRYLAARFGEEWMAAHGYDNTGPLPERVTTQSEHRKAKKHGYKEMRTMKEMR